MRLGLLWNPRLLCERIAVASQTRRRLARLKATVAEKLDLAYLDSLELVEIIKSHLAPEVIYDVGTCLGTWTILAKAYFPKASIHAFEPLSIHVKQFRNLTKGIPDITLHKVALGAQPGIFNIHVTDPSHSSSFLQITEACFRDYGVKNTRKELVNMAVLDEYLSANKLPLPNLIKLDVQGYELEVMRGAHNCLKHADWVLCEVSFEEYYKGQALFHEIAGFLHEYKFRLYALGINTPLGQRLTQADVLFGRNFK